MMETKRSSEIFDRLGRGNFISANAVEPDQRGLFLYIEEHYEELQELYLQVGFSLEEGDNYYYFSRVNESQQNIENKIEKALRWLDIMAFFKTFNSSFCRGYRFSPHDIIRQFELNRNLKEMLQNLTKKNGKKRSHQERIEEILKEMRKEGFLDEENATTQTWKVLDAWDYLEQMVMAVSIEEEEESQKQ